MFLRAKEDKWYTNKINAKPPPIKKTRFIKGEKKGIKQQGKNSERQIIQKYAI